MPEPQLFTVRRLIDETGVSGTGRVIDGIIFHTGQVVICWRSDINSPVAGHSSIGIYPSWDAFLQVHVHAHPAGSMEIQFLSTGEED
jgi:hypothetical protein